MPPERCDKCNGTQFECHSVKIRTSAGDDDVAGYCKCKGCGKVFTNDG